MDFDRNADELLAALGPDGLRRATTQAGDEYVLLLAGDDVAVGGPARRARDVAEHGLPDGERLLAGEQVKLDRYRALRRKYDALDERDRQ